MLIYKIFFQSEWDALARAGETEGAAVDRVDGYIHFSTAAQVAETAARHFAGQDGLMLAICDSDRMGDDLKWEISRGGAKFPHLYRRLRLTDVISAHPLPMKDGVHQFPEDLA